MKVKKTLTLMLLQDENYELLNFFMFFIYCMYFKNELAD